jgi:hypothetical protein
LDRIVALLPEGANVGGDTTGGPIDRPLVVRPRVRCTLLEFVLRRVFTHCHEMVKLAFGVTSAKDAQ